MANIDAVGIRKSPAEYIYRNVEHLASFFGAQSTCNRSLYKPMEMYEIAFAALVDEGCM